MRILLTEQGWTLVSAPEINQVTHSTLDFTHPWAAELDGEGETIYLWYFSIQQNLAQKHCKTQQVPICHQ